MAEDEAAVLLSYFRNNVLHLTATAAWVACCFLNNRRMSRASVLRLGKIIYPFIQGELFLPWDADGFTEQVQSTIDFFVRRGLLESTGEGRLLERGPGQDDGAFQLKVIARSLVQAFERYYITVATLTRHGPHTLSGGELETACTLTAQRLSLLNELSAPEFFDKALFRGFIQKLRERKVVWTDANGKLDYDETLEDMVRDARVILAREVRHSILKIAGDGEPARGASADGAPASGEATTPSAPPPTAPEHATRATAPAGVTTEHAASSSPDHGIGTASAEALADTLHQRHVEAEQHRHAAPAATQPSGRDAGQS
jgi:glycerol-3-phosphate O-acyltransferase